MLRAPRSSLLLLLALAACVIREQPPSFFGPPRSPPPPQPGAPYAQQPTTSPSPAPAPPAATPPSPASSAALQGCEGGYARYQPAALTASGAELHVIGIHEGAEVTGEHGVEPRQAVRITVDRPGKDVDLVLAAYNPIDWTVVATPGTRLRRAILSGYEEQRAVLPTGAKLDVYNSEAGNAFAAAYTAYQWPSVDAEILLNAAQAKTRLPLASFRACYRSAHFTITDEPASRPPMIIGPSLLQGCDKVLAENRRCVGLTSADKIGIVAIGLDSGAVCQGPSVRGVDAGGAGAMLGWIGDRIYMCVRERGLAEISLTTGAIRVAPIKCEGVTSDGTDLIVVPDHSAFGSPITRFPSFDALLASPYSGEELTFAGTPSRLAKRGNFIYSANHSTDEIGVAALDSGKRATIKLDRYDDWIFGLDALSNGNILVGSPRRTQRDLRLFDGGTGAQLRSYDLGIQHADIAAFKCREGAP